MDRLKSSEIAEHRAIFAEKQNNECALCNSPLDPEKSALDHCHDTGHVRGTLCTMCNQIEGRVLNWLGRSGKDIDPADMLENILAYWKADYSENPLHPTHYLEEELERKKLKKRLKKLKAPHAIARVKLRLRGLEFLISRKLGDDKPFVSLNSCIAYPMSQIKPKMLQDAETIKLYGTFNNKQLAKLLKFSDKILEEELCNNQQ